MQIVKKETGNAVERNTKQTDTFTLDFHTNKLHVKNAQFKGVKSLKSNIHYIENNNNYP